MSHSRAAGRVNRVAVQNGIVALLCAAVAFVLLRFDPASGRMLLPWLVLWMTAPAVASRLSKDEGRQTERLGPGEDQVFLRGIARQTWRYFDDLVGPGSNWLPPDNSQEALNVEIAARTSPTNIGMWLLSVLAARDFGYLTTAQMVERLSATVDTLEKLERHEGHFLNWYDTGTLEPLRPPYVSTVDSGNLLACFIVLKQALLEYERAPLVGMEALDGIRDALENIDKEAGTDQKGLHAHLETVYQLLLETRRNHLAPLTRLATIQEELSRIAGQYRKDANPSEPLYWLEKANEQATEWAGYAADCLGWVHPLVDLDLSRLSSDACELRERLLATVPSLLELEQGDTSRLFRELVGRIRSDDPGLALSSTLQELESAFERAQTKARQLLHRLRKLRETLDKESNSINLGFLYDPEKRLFTIGYSPALGRRDNSYYDLLSTEARLASFLAVARGEAPAEHWFTLGRPFRNANGRQLLMSWTGTMFEYLMPLLFTRCFQNSLLEHACRVAIDEQVDFGRRHGVPWGVSESAFSALDARRTYQYRAFGVPSLALHRETEIPVVIAPYATALALLLRPRQAVENLRRLAGLGLRGSRGFYEAVDYTRLSRREGEPGVIIYAYMAHHQGMSLARDGPSCAPGDHAGPISRRSDRQSR